MIPVFIAHLGKLTLGKLVTSEAARSHLNATVGSIQHLVIAFAAHLQVIIMVNHRSLGYVSRL